jgi:hypothetical protein
LPADALRKTRRSQVSPLQEVYANGIAVDDRRNHTQSSHFVAVTTALLVALIMVVSKMPDSNPLKRLLAALTYRVRATAAAGALVIPIERIPGINAVYDFAVPVLRLLVYVLARCLAHVQGICAARTAADRAGLPLRAQ